MPGMVCASALPVWRDGDVQGHEWPAHSCPREIVLRLFFYSPRDKTTPLIFLSRKHTCVLRAWNSSQGVHVWRYASASCGLPSMFFLFQNREEWHSRFCQHDMLWKGIPPPNIVLTHPRLSPWESPLSYMKFFLKYCFYSYTTISKNCKLFVFVYNVEYGWNEIRGYSLVVERDLAMVETGVRFSLPAQPKRTAPMGWFSPCAVRVEEANCLASVENRTARRCRTEHHLQKISKKY